MKKIIIGICGILMSLVAYGEDLVPYTISCGVNGANRCYTGARTDNKFNILPENPLDSSKPYYIVDGLYVADVAIGQAEKAKDVDVVSPGVVTVIYRNSLYPQIKFVIQSDAGWYVSGENWGGIDIVKACFTTLTKKCALKYIKPYA